MICTIIIPSYNQAEYLRDAIDSAINQSIYCEVIVIDDGSTDGSLDIAKSYGQRVIVISQKNKGLPAARNAGIMAATGRWILPLDADDILVENCAEILTKIGEEIDVDIVAPSFRCFGMNNEPVILMENPTIEDFKTGNRVGYFSAIRKSKLLECGGYSPKMLWGYEDYHLWHDLLSRGAKLKTIPYILVFYRTKPNSMITTADQHKDELLAQIRKDFPQIYE